MKSKRLSFLFPLIPAAAGLLMAVVSPSLTDVTRAQYTAAVMGQLLLVYAIYCIGLAVMLYLCRKTGPSSILLGLGALVSLIFWFCTSPAMIPWLPAGTNPLAALNMDARYCPEFCGLMFSYFAFSAILLLMRLCHRRADPSDAL